MQSFLQSDSWQTFQESLGTETLRHDGSLYLKRHTPFGSYLISSRCVLPEAITLPSSPSFFIRYEPENENSYNQLEKFAKHKKYRLVKSVAIQPKQTSIISLLKSDEDIIKSMKPKHRYNLKVAERSGLEIERISQFSEAAITRFLNLLATTAERHHFRLHADHYYHQLFKTLAPQGAAHLLFAQKDGQDCAALLLITHAGTATYLHGGSTKVASPLMAPYLLHLEAMRFARSTGHTQYDFWGTHLHFNPTTQTWETFKGHASEGTSRFKLGFAGAIVEYPGTYDLILNPFWYTLYKLGRALKRKPGAFN